MKRQYSETQVRKLLKRTEEETISKLANGLFGIYSLALHDIWHFDAQDLKKLKDRVDTYIYGLDDGSIKTNDIRTVLLDELNLEFRW